MTSSPTADPTYYWFVLTPIPTMNYVSWPDSRFNPDNEAEKQEIQDLLLHYLFILIANESSDALDSTLYGGVHNAQLDSFPDGDEMISMFPSILQTVSIEPYVSELLVCRYFPFSRAPYVDSIFGIHFDYTYTEIVNLLDLRCNELAPDIVELFAPPLPGWSP
jgi:hypothetical protein